MRISSNKCTLIHFRPVPSQEEIINQTSRQATHGRQTPPNKDTGTPWASRSSIVLSKKLQSSRPIGFTHLLMRNGIRTEKQQRARMTSTALVQLTCMQSRLPKLYCRESPRCSSIVNNAICGGVLGDKSSVVVFDMKTNALI